MSHHKIVGVSRTHIQVEDSDELIPKTDSWRACFGGTRNSGLGYYVRNDNAPDGWAATDPAEDVELPVDPAPPAQPIWAPVAPDDGAPDDALDDALDAVADEDAPTPGEN